MTLPEGFIVVSPEATQEECIAAWVKNLRNPNVRQARFRLVWGGAMCCLGVACATVGLQVDRPRAGTFDRSTYGLPPSVRDRLGLRSGDGDIADDFSLSAKNDMGATFAEIADLIESRPPGLFVESST